MNYELNPRNLALLGILDKFYQLYYDIDKIYADEFERTKSLTVADRKCRSKIREILDHFFISTSFVFSKEYLKLHPSGQALNMAILFINVIQPQPLHLECRIVSFQKFLTVLQNMVAAIIQQRKEHENIYISDTKATELINENILMLISRCTDKPLTFDSISKIEKLIVFKSLSLISCNIKKHNVVSDWILIKTVKDNRTIKLPIHLCKNCGRAFIGVQTLNVFEKIYGNLLIKTTTESKSQDNNYNLFNSESELHQYGYNVIEGNLTEYERHAILKMLLKNKKMTEFQIKRDIENALRLFSNDSRFASATSKWEKDLFFLSQYSLNHPTEQLRK